jgi:hypothetical protein
LSARVGSIKIRQISFPKNESFFFPEEFVPAKIRESAKKVRELAFPDTLGIRGRPNWSK